MIFDFNYGQLEGIMLLHLILGLFAILCSILLIVPLGYLCLRQLIFSAKGITTLEAFLKGIKEERMEFRLKERVFVGVR